ncbi:MAG TPA: T9SS type A sorting domain-containing protein [Chitinophagaceae bacterium]|nr:T9SS type A sorting domain-containing protein [Chitinophagaceae bacterium]
MQHNDLKRTGWNQSETVLTQTNVASGNFGLICKKKVDDQVYAQPLIVSNVKIGGKTYKNVLFTATVNNSVYAFNADDTSTSPLWQVNLTYKGYRAPLNTDMTGACGGNYQDFSGKMGTVCTPTIDVSTSTIYLLVRSVSNNGLTYVQYLHALDITTGKEKSGSPVSITAKIAGAGDGSTGSTIYFDEQHEGPRAGLLLYNGTVYMAWASHCDWSPYHGWVLGYDAATLKQKYVFNDTRNGGLGGIWMSGQAPAVDDEGYIYLSTGNGSVGSNGNPGDTVNRGESLLKLKPSDSTMKIVDFFTPDDYQYLEDNDLDYGVDGVLLIPNTNISLSGSKESYSYVINNNAMGGVTTNNSNAIQMLDVNASSDFYSKHLHGTPVYFKSSTGQEYVYAWAEGGLLKQFPFDRNAGKFDTANKIVGVGTLPYGMPGSMLALSSNGTDSGTGILWTSHPLQGDANQGVVPGVLEAYAADDVSHQLWSSSWNTSRDGISKFGKFVCPTIANGKVYQATFSGFVAVYGLNPVKAGCSSTLPAKWQSADIGYLAYPGYPCYSNGVFTIKSSGDDIWSSRDDFHYLFQPFNPASGDIVARVMSLDNTDVWAKCGVMFRKNLDPGSPNTFMVITIGNGASFQNRLLQGGDSHYSTNNKVVHAPYWVKLSKRGDRYIGYYSPNGINWTAVDSVDVSLGDYAYAGIAYTTKNNTVQGTSLVDNVSFTNNDELAIEIGKLTGKNVDNSYAALSWTSANKSSDDIFDVERSDDNMHYSLIGTVKASTEQGTHNYTFNDKTPLSGVNYYRVTQILKDGEFKYSNVLPLSFNTYIFNIYPNPARGQLFVRYVDDLGVDKTITVQLINSAGQIVYQHNVVVQGMANTVVLNLPASLAAGMYIVQAVNEKGEKRTRNLFIEK